MVENLMKEINLSLEIIGTECNGWPNLIVEFNKKVIYNHTIEGMKTIEIQLRDVKDNENKLVIGMTNKRFGKNHIWDTVTKDNKIIQDKTVKINKCMLNDVDVTDVLKNNLFRVNLVDKQPSYYPTKIYTDGIMNYNGYFFINFDMPLFNSIINQKYKQEKNTKLSYFSNYTLKFHYENELKLIENIEKKLKELHARISN